jgi:uncharacterized protein YggU (UPF0235/DUF167 family)
MPKASRNMVTGTAPTVGRHCVLTAQVIRSAGKQQGQRSAYTAVVKDVENTKMTWKIPKSALSIRTGASSRRKVILVVGCGVVLQSKLNDWIADHD